MQSSEDPNRAIRGGIAPLSLGWQGRVKYHLIYHVILLSPLLRAIAAPENIEYKEAWVVVGGGW